MLVPLRTCCGPSLPATSFAKLSSLTVSVSSGFTSAGGPPSATLGALSGRRSSVHSEPSILKSTTPCNSAARGELERPTPSLGRASHEQRDASIVHFDFLSEVFSFHGERLPELIEQGRRLFRRH